MRFLIDECLTFELVLEAGEEGYEAHHLVRMGKAGWLDWNLVSYAVAGDLMLVTNNAADFRELYRRQPIYPGLIIILPNVQYPLQRRLFREALAELKKIGDLINRVLEVRLDGEQMAFDAYKLSAEDV